MRSFSPAVKSLMLAGFVLALVASPALAQHYTQTNLVANFASTPPAGVIDPNLQNAWGLVASPGGSPWWVSNNAGGTSTLYAIDATGAAHIIPINGTGTVIVPNAPSQPAPGSPTGAMFNGSPTDFLLAPGKQAIFIFVSEDGTVSGWNPGVSPNAVIKVDNSQNPSATNGAVYKGSTIAEIDGKKFILAANFRSGRIDVFDTNFQPVRISEDAFEDEELLENGFAPFNVQGLGPNIYVTYAKQDAARHDPVGGAGLGFVNVFSPHGRLRQHLQHTASMNAPWGVVWAVQNFGEFSNTILVGQFRGGNISAFNPVTGRFLGDVLNPDGTTLRIDGLWALHYGNGGNSGLGATLFFTAGPNGEKDGLLGTLLPITAEKGEGDEQ